MQFSNQNISIYSCQFQAFIEKAKVQIKFPCTYFLQWKANNGKIIISSQNRFQANKSQIIFKQKLNININVLYDKINKKYLKKQSLLMINLISKSRPDQIKLVGRVSVDLAQVLNNKSFQSLTQTQLQYCSVQATMNFSIKIISVKESSMHISQLDRSSFNQYMSFQAAIKPNQLLMHNRGQGSSTHRDFDQQRSLKGSQDRQIRSLGRDKNKMSTSSLTKQPFTPSNKSLPKNQSQQFLQNRINRSSLQRSNSIPLKIQNSKPFNTQSAFHQLVNESQNNEGNFSFQQDSNQIIGNSQKKSGKRMSLSSSPVTQTQKSSIQNKQSEVKILNNINQKGILEIQSKKNISGQKQVLFPNKFLEPLVVRQSLNIHFNKQKQQFLHTKVTQYETNILQKDLKIKKLQNQLQNQNDKRTQSPVILNLSNMTQNRSISSSIKNHQNSVKNLNISKLPTQIQKSQQQSKRILNLTQALCQWQNKYSKLILQTQQSRSLWKKQKQQLNLTIGRYQNVVKVKQLQLDEKSKIAQSLKKMITQKQKDYSERLEEIIWYKTELQKVKNEKQTQQKQNLSQRKQQQAYKNEIKKLNDQIRILQQLSSQNQNQLNQSFAQRLTNYHNQNISLQNRLSEQEQNNNLLKSKLDALILELNHQRQKNVKIESECKKINLSAQQAHQQMFRLSEEKDELRRLLTLKQKQIEQVAINLKSSNNQQFQSIILQKTKQLNQKEQIHFKQICQLQQNYNKQIQQLKIQNQRKSSQNRNSIAQYQKKIQNLQNTILSVSQQIAGYQKEIVQCKNSIIQYQQKLVEKDNLLNQQRQNKESLSSRGNIQLKQKEQLLINLGNQLDQIIKQKQRILRQYDELNSTLVQKDFQILKIQQQAQKIRTQFEIKNAKIQIYQRKIHQQQSIHQQQIQNLNIQFTTNVYNLQNQLQQQFNKYHQLENIKQLLKQSLDQWQNKYSQDKINTSKIMAQLNDRIKQKQEVMNEMEYIMKGLEKDRALILENVNKQKIIYQSTITHLNNKILSIREVIDQQESQFLALYQAFKQEKNNLQATILARQQTISSLQDQLSQQKQSIIQFTHHIQNLKVSLQTTSSQLSQFQTKSEQQIKSITIQHNQELEQYEQKVKYLEGVINQKDMEWMERQIIVGDIQKQKEAIRKQLQQKIEIIYKYEVQNEQIKAKLAQKENQLSSVNQTIEQLKNSIEQKQQKKSQLQGTLLQNQQRLVNQIKTLQLESQDYKARLSQLQQKLYEMDQNLILQKQKYTQLQLNTKSKIEEAVSIELQKLQNFKQEQQIAKQKNNQKIQQLQIQLQNLKQNLDFKNKQVQILYEEKSLSQMQLQQLKTQLQSLKQERQTSNLLALKEGLQKYKSQIKNLQIEILQLKNQVNKIPSLERTIKIKNIELNSLKYKTSTSGTQSIDPNQVSHVEQIIQLKNQQIQTLRQQNQRIKDMQLQLHQIQLLNEQLYHDIEQYQEEKFHLNSQLNQKQIKIAELKEQNNNISSIKNELKQKNHQLMDKIKHYQTLIIDFKGPEISSTQSQSQKMNNSRGSVNDKIANKIVLSHNNQEVQLNHKNQIQTLLKKIKIYESQIQKFKIKQEQFKRKQEEFQIFKQQMSNNIQQKQEKITKNNNNSLNNSAKSGSTATQKPKIQFRNPQQAAQTFRQIQSLIKKRNQFHNLQDSLIKLYSQRQKCSQTLIQQDQHSTTSQQTSFVGFNNHQKNVKNNKLLKMFPQLITTVSSQFQKVKAKIMKLQGKNYQQKAKLIALLKPCEEGIKQMTGIVSQ